MGLTKRGKTWHFFKQYEGKRIYGSLETENKRVAEMRYAEVLKKISDGSYFERPKAVPLIREVIERYMKEVSPTQRGHDRNTLTAGHWYDFFGEKTISEVTPSLLTPWRIEQGSWAAPRPWQPAGVLHYTSAPGRRVRDDCRRTFLPDAPPLTFLM